MTPSVRGRAAGLRAYDERTERERLAAMLEEDCVNMVANVLGHERDGSYATDLRRAASLLRSSLQPSQPGRDWPAFVAEMGWRVEAKEPEGVVRELCEELDSLSGLARAQAARAAFAEIAAAQPSQMDVDALAREIVVGCWHRGYQGTMEEATAAIIRRHLFSGAPQDAKK